MKKILSLCTLCTLLILPTWLDAKVYKAPVATPSPTPVPVQSAASQANDEDQWNELPVKSGVVPGISLPYSAPAQKDSASVVRNVTAKLEAIDKRGYLDDLTLKDLLKDLDKKASQDLSSTVFKPAWEGLLDTLTAIKSDMNVYDHLSASRESAKLIEKARKKIVDIQDKVVALFNKIEDAIEDKKAGWYLRHTLLNFYEHLTSEWVNNPYGIDAGYKDILYGKDGKGGLVAMLKEDQPKSMSRPPVKLHGASMIPGQ